MRQRAALRLWATEGPAPRSRTASAPAVLAPTRPARLAPDRRSGRGRGHSRGPTRRGASCRACLSSPGPSPGGHRPRPRGRCPCARPRPPGAPDSRSRRGRSQRSPRCVGAWAAAPAGSQEATMSDRVCLKCSGLSYANWRRGPRRPSTEPLRAEAVSIAARPRRPRHGRRPRRHGRRLSCAHPFPTRRFCLYPHPETLQPVCHGRGRAIVAGVYRNLDGLRAAFQAPCAGLPATAYASGFAFNSASCSLINALISSVMASNVVHCSL